MGNSILHGWIMRRRYGKDARVWGWQVDNELTHYGKEPCFCDACQAKLRA